MTKGCSLFRVAQAREKGVGATLYAQPPAIVRSQFGVGAGASQSGGTVVVGAGASQPGAAGGVQPGQAEEMMLVSRADMDSIPEYDKKMVNWRVVKGELEKFSDNDQRVSWSDGSAFPWWIWLGNTGLLRDVVHDGVFSMEVEVVDSVKSLVVRSTAGTYRLSAKASTGNLQVRPPPPKYDPW